MDETDSKRTTMNRDLSKKNAKLLHKELMIAKSHMNYILRKQPNSVMLYDSLQKEEELIALIKKYRASKYVAAEDSDIILETLYTNNISRELELKKAGMWYEDLKYYGDEEDEDTEEEEEEDDEEDDENEEEDDDEGDTAERPLTFLEQICSKFI